MTDCWVGMPPERRIAAYGERLGTMHSTADGQRRCRSTDDSPAIRSHACSPGGGGRGPMRQLARLYEALLARGELDGHRVLTPADGRGDHRAAPRRALRRDLPRRCATGAWASPSTPTRMGRHASPRAFGHGGALSAISFADPEHGLVAVRADQRHVQQRRPLPPARRGHQRALRGSRPRAAAAHPAATSRSRPSICPARPPRSDEHHGRQLDDHQGRRREARRRRALRRAGVHRRRASTRRSSAATRWCASSRTRPTRWHAYPAVRGGDVEVHGRRRHDRRAARRTCGSSICRACSPARTAPACSPISAPTCCGSSRPDGGDPLRMLPGAPAAYHRGKRAMTLDLKHDARREVLRRLVADVDVVVESGLPAGAARRRASATRRSAADAARPGVVLDLRVRQPTARTRTAPRTTSRFLGYSGLLGADGGRHRAAHARLRARGAVRRARRASSASSPRVTARDRTGRGALRRHQHRRRRHLGASVRRWRASRVGGQAGWGQSANRRAYRAADGKLITVAAAEPRTWAALCEALERPDLADRLATPPEGQAALADGAGGHLRHPHRRRVGRAAPGAGAPSGRSTPSTTCSTTRTCRPAVRWSSSTGDGAGTRVRAHHRCGSATPDGSEEPFAAGPPPGAR